MDTLDTLAVFLLGVVLRIGLPLAVTALIVWLLRGLDAHWQAETERQRALVPAAPRAPCWVMNNCSAERRASCPIYGHPEIFCWQYFRDGQGRLHEACLECQVFHAAPIAVAA